MDLQRSAPDVEADIELALSELDRSVLEAKIHDDPLRLPLSALASFLRAQRGLYADSVVSMQRSIEAARQPVRDEDMRLAVVQGIAIHARGVAKAINIGAALIGVAMLLIAFGAGWGEAYWLAGGFKQQCQADHGGVACWYWKVVPATEPVAQRRD
jgi:hypothetical protein